MLSADLWPESDGLAGCRSGSLDGVDAGDTLTGAGVDNNGCADASAL